MHICRLEGPESAEAPVGELVTLRDAPPDDHDLLITLSLPEPEWHALPSRLRRGSQLAVVVVLFSQGVNEQQTIANATRSTALQA